MIWLVFCFPMIHLKMGKWIMREPHASQSVYLVLCVWISQLALWRWNLVSCYIDRGHFPLNNRTFFFFFFQKYIVTKKIIQKTSCCYRKPTYHTYTHQGSRACATRIPIVFFAIRMLSDCSDSRRFKVCQTLQAKQRLHCVHHQGNLTGARCKTSL